MLKYQFYDFKNAIFIDFFYIGKFIKHGCQTCTGKRDIIKVLYRIIKAEIYK